MVKELTRKMKDSGIEWIGEIPGHWETMRLKYQYRLHGRIGWQGLTTSDRIDYGPYLITGIDFINGKVDFTNSYCISEERWEEAYKIQVNNGDLLITKDGTIGKVAIVEGLDRKASLNSGIMLIEAISKVNKKFMYWVLLSDLFYKWFNIINVGVSTILHLYQKDFYDFAYTLPPLKEQEQIVSYLDKKCSQVDQIISSKEKLLIEMEAYKKSLIYETVTGKREVE